MIKSYRHTGHPPIDGTRTTNYSRCRVRTKPDYPGLLYPRCPKARHLGHPHPIMWLIKSYRHLGHPHPHPILWMIKSYRHTGHPPIDGTRTTNYSRCRVRTKPDYPGLLYLRCPKARHLGHPHPILWLIKSYRHLGHSPPTPNFVVD